MSRALFGDTSTPVYGSPDDPNYAKSGYGKIEDGYDGYAKEFPKYVKKPNRIFEKSSTVGVYSMYDDYVGPKIWIKPANSFSWIDASKNRGKIKASLAVICGLVLFIIGALFMDMFFKKISERK